jgi:hypothetical protein
MPRRATASAVVKLRHRGILRRPIHPGFTSFQTSYRNGLSIFSSYCARLHSIGCSTSAPNDEQQLFGPGGRLPDTGRQHHDAGVLMSASTICRPLLPLKRGHIRPKTGVFQMRLAIPAAYAERYTAGDLLQVTLNLVQRSRRNHLFCRSTIQLAEGFSRVYCPRLSARFFRPAGKC